MKTKEIKTINFILIIFGVIVAVFLVYSFGFSLTGVVIDTPKCTDSDEGVLGQQFIGGYVKAVRGSGSDRCTTFFNKIVRVKEYYCFKNNGKYRYFHCKDGCSDGACIRKGLLNPPERETIEIKGTRDTATLKVKTHTGDEKTITWYNNKSAPAVLANEDREYIRVREGVAVNYSEWVVVGNEDEGYLLEVKEMTNDTYSYVDDGIKLRDLFSDREYTATITSEGSGTVAIAGKEYNVTYLANKRVDKNAWRVWLNYPDSTSAGEMILFPTIETSKGAKIAFYEPLTVNINNWNYLGNKLETIMIPNGNGSYTRWDIKSRKTTITIGNLKYQIKNNGTVLSINLISPETESIIANPALIIFEEEDNYLQNNALVIQMEGAGTSIDEVGVKDVIRTWSHDRVCDEVQLIDDDYYKEADNWGTIAIINKTELPQVSATISYPDEQDILDLNKCTFSL